MAAMCSVGCKKVLLGGRNTGICENDKNHVFY